MIEIYKSLMRIHHLLDITLTFDGGNVVLATTGTHKSLNINGAGQFNYIGGLKAHEVSFMLKATEEALADAIEVLQSDKPLPGHVVIDFALIKGAKWKNSILENLGIALRRVQLARYVEAH